MWGVGCRDRACDTTRNHDDCQQSPGECGDAPIVDRGMDEPTNHLDLPSIECLEQTLRECACALLLVSHDARFPGTLVETCWSLTGGVLHLGRVATEAHE